MRSHFAVLMRFMLVSALCLWISAAQATAQQHWHKTVFVHDGLVILGYAPATKLSILGYEGETIWSGTVGSAEISRIPLRSGHYTLSANDEVAVIATDMAAYDTGIQPEPKLPPANPAPAAGEHHAGPHALSVKPLATVIAPALKVIPVPWVADANFASTPPTFASSHTIFNGVNTRLKATVANGVAPFNITWDSGDGTPPATFSTSDQLNGAAVLHTYAGIPVGTQIRATVTVTDANNATSTGYYYMLVGDPTNRASRALRSSDEALWFLHTQVTRADNYQYDASEPLVNEGYINTLTGGNGIASSAMFAICLENTGRSITGGKNFSHDSLFDPYVDDLNRLINFLTDKRSLVAVNIAGQVKAFQHGGNFNPDTHGPGGVPNSIALVTNSGSAVYEGGMQLQAIAQAGFVTEMVPNRTEYSYYDLLGDFVDAFQWAQGYSGTPEGGWRYALAYNYNDADGSTAAWAYIGMRAAEFANTLTPGPAASYPTPIVVAQITKDEIQNYWAPQDQVRTDTTSTFPAFDRRLDPTGATYKLTHYYGGFGYGAGTSGTNSGKTGGGLVGLKFVGLLDTDPNVLAAQSFLYRNFYNYDYLFGWSSARDSYGMYNMLKGLTEAHVGTLTDPAGTGGNDYDGRPLNPFDWYGTLTDFIAGPSDVDLGHQMWAGTGGSASVSSQGYAGGSDGALDGHFESTGTHGDDWAHGSSDGYAGINLITAWDLAILVGTVFTPGPIAHIAHPDQAAGETYIPLQVNGTSYSATFDPAGSYELNPGASINHVHWDFGDGTPVDDYTLPFPSPAGGAVPSHAGNHPAGNQTQHSYVTLGDYTVTLTVSDTAGLSNTVRETVHVIPHPFPPIAAMNANAQGISFQNGNTIGVLPDGTVTIQFDGTVSFNPDPASVATPVNAKGISAFKWEWPMNPNTGFNSGQSEVPNLFDEGVTPADPNLNAGSAAGLQTYTFHFDPGNIPNSVNIGLNVKSNITQTNGNPPNNNTIYTQISLQPNSQVTPASSDVAITKTAAPSPNVLIGQTVTYTLGISNLSVGAAKNVVVTDNLPAGLTFVSANATGGGVVANTSNNVTVTYSALAAGPAQTVTLVATVNADVVAGASIANTATISSAAPDPNTANNTATVTVTANNPTPALASLTPSQTLVNSADTPLTVSGTGFIPSSTIQWNGTGLPTTYHAAAGVNPAYLTTTIPASDLTMAASNSVTVVNVAPGGGTSNALIFTVNNPVPVIASLSPSSALVGGPAFTLTIKGSNLLTSSVVLWNGSPRTTTYNPAVSGTPAYLTAAIPASDLNTAGTVPVTLSNPAPGGGVSSPLTFSINNPAPTLATLSPTSVTAGSSSLSMVLTGTNFVSTSHALWNGTPITTVYVSATTLNATVPQSALTTAGPANVTVSNPAPGGGVSNALVFTVNGSLQFAIASASATRSGGVSVTFTVKNIGTLNATGAVIANALLSGTRATGGTPSGSFSVAAGATSSPIVITFPSSVTAGKKVLALTITAGGRSLSASKLITLP